MFAVCVIAGLVIGGVVAHDAEPERAIWIFVGWVIAGIVVGYAFFGGEGGGEDWSADRTPWWQ